MLLVFLYEVKNGRLPGHAIASFFYYVVSATLFFLVGGPLGEYLSHGRQSSTVESQSPKGLIRRFIPQQVLDSPESLDRLTKLIKTLTKLIGANHSSLGGGGGGNKTQAGVTGHRSDERSEICFSARRVKPA
jgi:hypothetical protein